MGAVSAVRSGVCAWVECSGAGCAIAAAALVRAAGALDNQAVMMRMVGLLAVVLLLVLGAPRAGAGAREAPSPRLTNLVDRAEALLDAGKPADAYRLLDGELAAHAGNARFDYILALAAIQAERPDAALLPLWRVVSADPGFNPARLELGDLLAQFDDPEAARQQYDAILANRPSAVLRDIVERRLDALPLSGKLGRIRLSLESDTGWDSNANLSTNQDSFQGLVIDPRLQAAESPYMNIALGARRDQRHNDTVTSSVRAAVAHRANPDAPFVDQTVAVVQATVSKQWGRLQLSVAADAYAGWLDDAPHRRSAGVELGAAVAPWPRWELSGAVRYGRLEYDPLPLRLLDVDRLFGGVAIARAGIGRAQLRIGVAALGGQDRVRIAGSPYSNDRYGARLFASVEPSARLRIAVEAGQLVSDYYDGGGFFGVDRLDRTQVAAAFIEWRTRPVRGWVIGPRILYSRNESNVTLFDYERVETAFHVRYEFR